MADEKVPFLSAKFPPWTPRDVLEFARTLLAAPERWTQKAEARDGNGNAVEPSDPTAVCWSAEGALLHVGTARGETYRKAHSALKAAAATEEAEDWYEDPEFSNPIAAVNDLGDHARILAVFDRAIEKTR